MPELKHVTIYTDGACIGNPGLGGYGVVILYGGHRKEISGGFTRTTNNRMELMAAIVGLLALNQRCKVTLYSDSEYVVKAVTQGWAKRWRANGWKRNKKDMALNADLWEKLLDLCEQHEVQFNWVKGHNAIPENEKCDELSNEAASKPNLPKDAGYEEYETQKSAT
jgi:ribonuclease HI